MCLHLALTLTARCSWLSSSVRAAPRKGFWKTIMLSMTPCSSPPRTRLGVRQLPRWSVSPPSLSPLMSPLHPAPFLVQKALKTVESEESVFPCRTASGMPEPPNSLVFGGKRAPDDHFAQFSAFGPEKRRIPARRACHRLSPLRHRFVTGPKSAQKRPSSREDSVLGKFESIMEPGDSSMSHGRARLVQGWLMNAPQVIAAETSVLRRSHEAEVSQAF